MAVILTIDDDNLLLVSLKGLLSRAGDSVVAVPSPDYAMAYVRLVTICSHCEHI